MQALFTRTVALPLLTITACQTILTLGAYVIPVVTPVAAADFGIEPESVGFLVAVSYLTAMLVGLGSGRWLARIGPARMFQIILAIVGAGAIVFATPSIVGAVLGAILIGAASGPMNPSGSLVLARVAPANIRALVFSLKQCGTPAGGMLAGVMMPPLMLMFGWQYAMLAVPVAALLVIAIVPFGGLAPTDQRPKGFRDKDASGGIFSAIKLNWTHRGLRATTAFGFGLAVCQMGLATYLVVYLWQHVGYSPAEAGLVFAALHLSGIVSRVVLGFIADRFVASRWILVFGGAFLVVALVAITQLTPDWPLSAVYAVMILAGASGNGWVGLYFAELARLSPTDKVAEVAAGSQFITYLGIVCGPTLFGLLLNATESYAVCFATLSAVALICSLYLATVRS